MTGTCPGPGTAAGLAQKRRTVRALELLGASYEAYKRGDGAACDAAIDRAVEECGGDTVLLLQGGMRIGEVPKPQDQAWGEFLAAQQDGLARAEADGGAR